MPYTPNTYDTTYDAPYDSTYDAPYESNQPGYDNNDDNSNQNPETLTPNFYLNCLKAIALVAGPVMCLIAAVVKSPLLLAAGLAVTAVGVMAHFYKKGFNGFFGGSTEPSPYDEVEQNQEKPAYS